MRPAPCTLPDDVAQTFTDRRHGASDTVDIDLSFTSGWQPEEIAEAFRDVVDNMEVVRHLHLELGNIGFDLDLNKALTAQKLQSLHIQSSTPIGINFSAPRLHHLSLDGVQLSTALLTNTLTDLRLANITIPLAILHCALGSSQQLSHFTLDRATVLADQRYPEVFAPRLSDVEIRLDDARATRRLLAMLPLARIKSLEVGLSFAAAENLRIINTVVPPRHASKLRNMRYEGIRLEFSTQSPEMPTVRRFVDVSPTDVLIILRHLDNLYSLCSSLQGVMVEVLRLPALAAATGELPAVRTLQITRGGAASPLVDTLHKYLCLPLQVSFPALTKVDLYDHAAQHQEICDTLIKRLRESLGRSERELKVEWCFFCPRGEEYPSTCEPYVPRVI